MELGKRIRKIRKRQGRTLEAIAKRCGCTRSLLSKIETGAANPPVATLTKIAGALGVPVSVFMEDSGQQSTVFVPSQKLAGATIAGLAGALLARVLISRRVKKQGPQGDDDADAD